MKLNKIIGFCILMLLCICSVNAYTYESVDYDSLYVHVFNSDNIEDKRTDLNNWIWKSGKTNYTPTLTYDIANTVSNFVMSDTSNLDQIDKIEYTNERNFYYVQYLYTPITKNNRLFIFNTGHGAGTEGGSNAMVQALINEGYYVLVNHMVCTGPNTGDYGTGSTCHDAMASLENSTYNPMEDFFNHLYSSVSYLEDTYSFTDISMAGISGGGWTTVFYSALDDRITSSYPVAGSYPRFIYDEVMSTGGDWEQGTVGTTVHTFLTNNVSYLDMYILGGSNGRMLAVYNQYDSCCFSGTHYTYFEDYINYKSKILGGTYEVYLTTSSSHEITTGAKNLIISTNTLISEKTYYRSMKINIDGSTNTITNTTLMSKGFIFSTTENIINFITLIGGA